MQKVYNGKNVVITGGSSGIGKAVAGEFLRRGDNVIIASKNYIKMKRTHNELNKIDSCGQCYSYRFDVTRPKDCQKLVNYATSVFDNVDIWINNAGTNGFKYAKLSEFDVHEYDNIVSANLLGTIYCCKYILPIFHNQMNGTLVNLEGAGSNGLATPLYSVYGATKSGITQLTKSLRKENEHDDVYICLLSPGMVLTNLLVSDADNQTKQIFNIFCEDTSTISKFIVDISLGNKKSLI